MKQYSIIPRENPDIEELNCWISHFIAEVTTRGQVFRFLQDYKGLPRILALPRFFKRVKHVSAKFCGTCDTIYKDLRSKGIGAEVCHAPVITPEEEDKLWQSSVLTLTNPKALQRCVLFYIGKPFCIRGGQEQRDPTLCLLLIPVMIPTVSCT